MKKIYFLLCLMIIFTGCSYNELNDLAIATAISIDYKDEKILLEAQILSFDKETDSNNKSVIIYKSEGKTVGEAIRNVYKKYPNKLHLGHLELLIVSKDAANEKLSEILDYFIRSPEARSDCNFVIAMNTNAKDIIKPSEKEEKMTSEEIINSIKNASKYQGTVFLSSLEKIAKTYLEKGIMPAVTALEYTDDDYTTVKSINLVGINKNNKVTNPMNKKSAIAYNTIYENYDDIMLNIPFKGTYINVIIYNLKTNKDIKINKNKLNYTIDIKAEAHISQIKQEYDLNKKEIQEEITKSIKKEYKSYIKDLIKYCKENNIDLIGLKQLLYKKYYKEYKDFKNTNFYDSDIKINVDIKLFRYGNTFKGIGDNDE